MDILLDTCTFLWLITDDKELTRNVRDLFTDPRNNVYLSAASSWEIAVKYTLGKLPLPENPVMYIPKKREDHGIAALDISEEAVLHLTKLPHIHEDPFDRILVCQSLLSGFLILTPDPLIHQYPVKVLWE